MQLTKLNGDIETYYISVYISASSGISISNYTPAIYYNNGDEISGVSVDLHTWYDDPIQLYCKISMAEQLTEPYSIINGNANPFTWTTVSNATYTLTEEGTWIVRAYGTALDKVIKYEFFQVTPSGYTYIDKIIDRRRSYSSTAFYAEEATLYRRGVTE